MTIKFEGFEYSEKYRCWEGDLKVKCSEDLFGQTELALKSMMDSQEPLTEANYHALCYVRDHFDEIYETILKTLFEWQTTGQEFEVFDKETYNFDPIVFESAEEIHPFLGKPVLEIVPDYEKEGQSYFCINFFKDCLLSIEHGLTALCHKNEVIDIEASETISMLELLCHFEKDCSLWKKDFWRVRFQLKDDIYREIEAGRKMWIGKK